MPQLFQITHEVSTTVIHATNYTGQIGTDGTIVVGAALAGSYGLQTNITANSYCYRNQTAPASNEIRVGFRFRNRTLVMTDGDIFESLYVACSNTPWRIASLFIRRSGADIQAVVYSRNDAGTYAIVGAYTTIGTTAHTIEIYIKRATTNVAADGIVTWWLDGTQIGTLTNVDNYDAFALLVDLEIGCITGRDAGTSGIVDYDDVTMRDDATQVLDRVHQVRENTLLRM